jgi:hypothetical protein
MLLAMNCSLLDLRSIHLADVHDVDRCREVLGPLEWVRERLFDLDNAEVGDPD